VDAASLVVGVVIGVLIPYGVPGLIKWAKKLKNGEEPD
jgi:hypothetical protein